MNQTTIKPNHIFDESTARIKLAAVYRMIDYFGWSHLTLTHASTRVPNSDSHFLINPMGIYFDAIQASNLVKMDLEGNIIGDDSLPVNPTGFVLHSAILEARPDINTVIHGHTPYGIVVSTLECGLLTTDQTSMIFHNRVAYHDYQGLAMEKEEKTVLAEDLGEEKLFMILRNHGLLVCGRSIDEALVNLYLLESACRTQVLAMSTGAKLNQASEEVISNFQRQFEGVLKKSRIDPHKPNLYRHGFEALMRELESIDPSYAD